MGKLTEEQIEKLEKLFTDRSMIMPLGIGSCEPQAENCSIYQLEKMSDDEYFLMPENGQAEPPPRVHGIFIFVILDNCPIYVFCTKIVVSGEGLRQRAVGHTTLAKRNNVAYAGQIEFDNGKLVYWDNKSGHYMPAAMLRPTNILPVIQRLLPEDKFIDAFPPRRRDPRNRKVIKR